MGLGTSAQFVPCYHLDNSKHLDGYRFGSGPLHIILAEISRWGLGQYLSQDFFIEKYKKLIAYQLKDLHYYWRSGDSAYGALISAFQGKAKRNALGAYFHHPVTLCQFPPSVF